MVWRSGQFIPLQMAGKEEQNCQRVVQSDGHRCANAAIDTPLRVMSVSCLMRIRVRVLGLGRAQNVACPSKALNCYYSYFHFPQSWSGSLHNIRVRPDERNGSLACDGTPRVAARLALPSRIGSFCAVER